MRLGDRGAMGFSLAAKLWGAVSGLSWQPRTEFALWGFLPFRDARWARLSPCRRPRTAAATARPFYEHRTMSIETWTAERIEQLRNCVVSGLTCSQIAAEIGVTRNAVIGKIHRLGLLPAGPPRFSPSSRLLRLIGAEAPGIAENAAAASAPIDSAQRCSLLEIAQDK